MQVANWKDRLVNKGQNDTHICQHLLKLQLLDQILMPPGEVVNIQKEAQRTQSAQFQHDMEKAIELARQIADSIIDEGEDREEIAEWLSHRIGKVVGQLMEDWQLYVNREVRYGIHYPPEWSVQEVGGQEPAKHQAIFSDRTGRYSFNIMVNPAIRGRTDLGSFQQSWEASVKSRRGRMESTNEINVAGYAAFEGISLMRKCFRWGRFSTRVKKVALAFEDQEMIITASTPIQGFEAFDKLFNRSLHKLTVAD